MKLPGLEEYLVKVLSVAQVEFAMLENRRYNITMEGVEVNNRFDLFVIWPSSWHTSSTYRFEASTVKY